MLNKSSERRNAPKLMGKKQAATCVREQMNVRYWGYVKIIRNGSKVVAEACI
jgi:hypothetical protein